MRVRQVERGARRGTEGEERKTGSPRRRRSGGGEIRRSTSAAAFQKSCPSARQTPPHPPHPPHPPVFPSPSSSYAFTSRTPLHFGYQSIQLNLNSRIFNLLRLGGGGRSSRGCEPRRLAARLGLASEHPESLFGIFFFPFSGCGGCSSFFWQLRKSEHFHFCRRCQGFSVFFS